MSAEYEGNIDDKLRLTQNYVENELNAMIAEKNYAIELDSWDCIVILMKEDDPNFEERYFYSKKKRDMDFRLKIDYQKFLDADELGRERLIYQMLERSLDILIKKGISSRGIEELRKDIRSVAIKKQWLILS